MTIRQDVLDYLASVGVPSGRYSNTVLDAAIVTETQAQNHKIGGAISTFAAADQPVLTEALCRRVQVNLAKRALALGVVDSTGDTEGGRVFLPNQDPEVRRLEKPYTKIRVG